MDSAAAKEHDGRGHGLVICNLQRTEHDTNCVLRIFAELDVVMAALLSELRLHGDAVAEETARPHAGARLDEDIYIVRGFDAATGEPSSNPAAIVEWDLRIGRYLRLTGGPYNGDIGRVIEKSASGHFKLRFDHSVDPTFRTRRRPFSLWLGAWWIEEALHGRGIGPGGPIPVVAAEPPVEVAAVSKGADDAAAARRARVLVKIGLPRDAIWCKLKIEGFSPSTIAQLAAVDTPAASA